MKPRFWSTRHGIPGLLLVLLNLIYWSKVLLSGIFAGNVYLPGKMLAGFAPFGGRADAPWNILQWDALGQYYPWRHFAAQQLQQGVVPLWNPYQFSGAPFVANLQSAVFYPLNLPFWIFNTAYAFAIAAALHTLLATFGTYFLAQRWKMSRPASILAAVGFGFCGYLATWFTLPTLADTACWLPLLLLLLEATAEAPQEKKVWRLALLSLALACAVLAGHVQIFLYIVAALILRALFLIKPLRALVLLMAAGIWSFALAALQIFPTLELAKLGHRSGGEATAQVWQQFIVPRALQWIDLPALFLPRWPSYSFNENFGYMGVALCLLAVAGIAVAIKARSREGGFVAVLAIFGLLYALATPLAEAIFLYVPGVAQMGGPGRALLLWSFGVAMLAALALDAFIKRELQQNIIAGRGALPGKSTFAVSIVVLVIALGELYGFAHMTQPIARASTIYPATALTDWLQKNVPADERVLLVTPRENGSRENWLPSEMLQQIGRNHPVGVLPPNGAMVYGLKDISGYDSLSPKAYREFLIKGEGKDVSPMLNGNMILVNGLAPAEMDALRVGFIVEESDSAVRVSESQKVLLDPVWQGDGCIVYRRTINKNVPRKDGKDFYPGWKEGVYQPTTFRFGLFVSLFAWLLVAVVGGFAAGQRKKQ